MAAPFGIGGITYCGATLSQRGSFRTDTARENLVPGYVFYNVTLGYVAASGGFSVNVLEDTVVNKLTFSRGEEQTPCVSPLAHRSLLGATDALRIHSHRPLS